MAEPTAPSTPAPSPTSTPQAPPPQAPSPTSTPSPKQGSSGAAALDTEAYPNGRPMSLSDFMAPDEKEYIRTPGFLPGQVVVLQSLTAGDLIEWSEASEGSEQKRLAGLRLITKAVVDGEPGVDAGAVGRVLMNESHINILKSKSHKKTEAIVKAIVKQNGMRVKGDSDAKNE